MKAGYYHYRQLKSMKLHDLRPGYELRNIEVLEGESPTANLASPFFKDEYIWVNTDGIGTLLNEDATYRDYMEFTRLAHNHQVND